MTTSATAQQGLNVSRCRSTNNAVLDTASLKKITNALFLQLSCNFAGNWVELMNADKSLLALKGLTAVGGLLGTWQAFKHSKVFGGICVAGNIAGLAATFFWPSNRYDEAKLLAESQEKKSKEHLQLLGDVDQKATNLDATLQEFLASVESSPEVLSAIEEMIRRAQEQQGLMAASVETAESVLDDIDEESSNELFTAELVTKLAETLPGCRKAAKLMEDDAEKASHQSNLKGLREMVREHRNKGSN